MSEVLASPVFLGLLTLALAVWVIACTVIVWPKVKSWLEGGRSDYYLLRKRRLRILRMTVVVGSTLGFFSWGISKLDFSSATQAQWAETFGVVVGIAIAAIAPVWHYAYVQRRSTAQRARALAAIACHCSESAERLGRQIAAHVGARLSIGTIDPTDLWDQILHAVAAVNVHELPDDGLVYPWIELAEIVERIRLIVYEVHNSQPPPSMSTLGTKLSSLYQRLGVAVEAIVAVHHRTM